MNATAQNHKAFFELLALSTDVVKLFQHYPVYSLTALQGVYPKLALCYHSASTQSLEAYIASVEEHQSSPYIIVESNEHTQTIQQLLKKNGFKLIEEWTSMRRDLELLPQEINDTKLTIERVKTTAQLQQWLLVVGKSLFNGNDIDERIFAALLHNDQVEMWLGFLNEQPICTTLAFTHHNHVGLYMVATLDGYRAKGYASEITLRTLHEAAKKGTDGTVLHATREALSMYRRIGFLETEKYRIFWKLGKAYI